MTPRLWATPIPVVTFCPKNSSSMATASGLETSLPHVEEDGVCDYLLRSPLQQVKAITETLKKFGITATVCGRVRVGGNTVILTRDPQGNRDIPVVSLPATFLATMSPVYLYPMGISLKQGSA